MKFHFKYNILDPLLFELNFYEKENFL